MTRILVVDDKEENRYYLESLLKGNGFIVESARHGAEALTMARLDPPDIVISDLLMPVMDGYTLLRYWKADARLKGAPFIVYTATYTEPEDERLALSLGADAFILKPADPADFLDRLREVQVRVASSSPAMPKADGTDDKDQLKNYSETLIRKLEEKTIQLEEANRSLERDIADRRVVETALRESEEDFRTLANEVPQIVWVALPDGGIVYFNRRWTDYTGLSLEESAGDGWMKPFSPEDAEMARQARQDARKSGRTYSLECRLRRADGVYRWWLLRSAPFHDATGKIVKWFGTGTDIHDLKETQDQLRQSQRLDVVGQLTGGIAHDFNNILNVIMANVDMLEEEEVLPPSVSERVGQISRSVERAADLIRQLLAFSRKQPLRPQSTNVTELVASTGKLLHRALGEQIEIDFVLADDPWTVNVDRAQLEAALLNLCVNARDAMPNGGRLRIETRNVMLDADHRSRDSNAAVGDYVLLAVTDTGSGIPPDVIDKVFEPYFTTKGEGKGTGLGLSMVYGFIRQSNGHVNIVSEIGRGTTVNLLLPRGDGQAESAAASQTGRLPHGSERILMVEDDVDVRASVGAQLRSLGYDVSEAANGEAGLALSAAATRPFDILLTDVIMPGRLNGRQLAEGVIARWPTTKVVFMSGYSEDAIVHNGRLDAGVLLLTKPFRKSDLAHILRKAIEGMDGLVRKI